MASGTMTDAVWTKYRNAVNSYSDTVANEAVIWKRVTSNVDRWQEGMAKIYEDTSISCLVAYNTFRTWPVDSRTDTGIIDKEYCHLYLNKAYLEAQGWLTPNGQLDFNPDFDRFILDGLTYKPAGDTGTAQANTNPLFIIVILEREETSTGDKVRP